MDTENDIKKRVETEVEVVASSDMLEFVQLFLPVHHHNMVQW